MPLEAKIALARKRIREWYEHYEGQVYIAFSGGKDSTVLMHLVKELYPDVPAVFCDTGLEYPEVRNFAIKNADVVLKPKLNFKEILSQYGYPVISKDTAKAIEEYRKYKSSGTQTMRMKQLEGEVMRDDGKKSFYDKSKYKYLVDSDFKISYKCCYHMKESPMNRYEKESGRKPYIGTMADESLTRQSAYFKTGCNAYSKTHPKSKPLSIWTENDIFAYILQNNLEYPSVYGEIICVEGEYKCTGVERTGCMFCAFGAHLEKEPNRFQRLKETHPRQWQYLIGGGSYDTDKFWKPSKDGLGMGHVLKHIGVRTE